MCCLFGILYSLDLNHLVRVFYLFIFSYLWRQPNVAFSALNQFFHLPITDVCYKITSPVTGKSTDLAFKFGKIVGLSLFDIDK